MEERNKVKFEEYDIEFSEEDLENMKTEELKDCKKIIEEIKDVIGE